MTSLVPALRQALPIVALLWLACSSRPQPVRLSAGWPDDTRPYEDVVANWTRTGSMRADLDKVLEVHATYKSPEWRAAYVDYKARKLGLPAAARQKLMDEHRQEAEQFHELEVLVETYDWRENDLQKGARSVWRLALIDDQGNQVTPVSIKRDRRPDDIIRAEFPRMNDFATAYVVRFPASLPILRDDSSQFAFRMGSSRGAVTLTWQANR